MLEAEEELEAALRARQAVDRDQRQRLVWTRMTAASYAVDILFLALFAAAGTISGSVALAYGGGAAVLTGSVYGVILKGWNLRWRDPNLVDVTTILAIALQLGVVLAAPQVAFPFLANLFTVFSFAMIWLSLRDSVVVWTLGTAGTAAVFFAVQGRIGVPAASAVELLLVWLYFSLILARCLLLSMNANEMRERLAGSRRKLAVALGEVQQLASRDELTRALNRRSLMAALERERSRMERAGAPFSIGLIDIDLFKQVNDTYGHAAGDAVLRGIAEIVGQTMRVTDVFGRYGGEEFLIILVGSESAAAAEALERIRAAVAAKEWPAIAPGRSITLSAGIATSRKGESVEQLLNRADQALYQAKHAGRNRIIVSP